MCLLFLVASTSALPVEPSVVYVCVCKGKICLLFLVALTSALPVEPSDVYVCVCKGKICVYKDKICVNKGKICVCCFWLHRHQHCQLSLLSSMYVCVKVRYVFVVSGCIDLSIASGAFCRLCMCV